MTRDEVVSLMQSSATEDEWNGNADKVKGDRAGEYPDFWFESIIMSGVMGRTAAKWGGTDKIKVSGL